MELGKDHIMEGKTQEQEDNKERWKDRNILSRKEKNDEYGRKLVMTERNIEGQKEDKKDKK